MPVPTISPSPWQHGRHRDRTARRRRRPENRPSSPARSGGNPCCRRWARWSRSRSPGRSAGATPKQPIIGASGADQSASAGGGSASRAVPLGAVESPDRALARRQPVRPPRSTHIGGDRRKRPSVVAVGVMRSIRISSVSPGSAPSTKKGPVIGLGGRRPARRGPSKPQASTVAATIVSPSATGRTGSAVPMALWKRFGSNSWRASDLGSSRSSRGAIMPTGRALRNPRRTCFRPRERNVRARRARRKRDCAQPAWLRRARRRRRRSEPQTNSRRVRHRLRQNWR